MFISKRKWEEMCERIDVTSSNLIKTIRMVTELQDKLKNYDAYEKRVEKLLDAHVCVYDEGYQEIRSGNSVRYYSKVLKEIIHKNQTSSTNQISDITLEELARLVIDGTPITRKVMEENIKEYGRME